MSLHPSLRKAGKSKTNKTVLKRNERIKWLKERNRWDDEKGHVYGLPKIKIVKVKTVKKEKAAAEKPEETKEGATPAASAPKATAPKASAPKASAPKA